MKLKIKVGDTVKVVAGAEKGKSGSALHIDTKKLKIKVQGVRIQTKHDKKDGLKKAEGFIDYSNVKLLSPKEKS